MSPVRAASRSGTLTFEWTDPATWEANVLHGDDGHRHEAPDGNVSGDATAALRRGLSTEARTGPDGRHGWEEAQLRSVCLQPG